MIRSSTQIELQGGVQLLTFSVTTSPTSAEVIWEEGRKTVPVEYAVSTGNHSLRVLVPAEKFYVRLNTEPNLLTYETDWKEPVLYDSEETEELHYKGNRTFSVPYCDLSKIDLKLYDSNNQPMIAWRESTQISTSYASKIWEFRRARVGYAYGGQTLLADLQLGQSVVVKKQGSSEWIKLSQAGEYVVEVTGLTQVIQDPVARKTITREELYGPIYRRRMP